MKCLFAPSTTGPVPLPKLGSWPESSHLFDERTVWAIRTALATGRPLLLRGEPGIGKSQIARATACFLKVPFLWHVVDERTERDDLLYGYDAVARLAQAQVAGALARSEKDWEECLRESHFVRPGILWWAIHWADAARQARAYSRDGRMCAVPDCGVDPEAIIPGSFGPVVLVDELDKADPSVPNGLLETLGNDGFSVAQPAIRVSALEGAPRPLVFVTTNEERDLPPAFLRRCLVLQLKFPTVREETIDFLKKRARVHCGPEKVSEEVLGRAAELVIAGRIQITDPSAGRPGAAEFLDLVRGLSEMHPGDADAQRKALDEISPFVLQKHLVGDA